MGVQLTRGAKTRPLAMSNTNKLKSLQRMTGSHSPTSKNTQSSHSGIVHELFGSTRLTLGVCGARILDLEGHAFWPNRASAFDPFLLRGLRR